jgi:hypothetical protein
MEAQLWVNIGKISALKCQFTVLSGHARAGRECPFSEKTGHFQPAGIMTGMPQK